MECNILIIEDDDLIRKPTCKYFERHGYKVVTTTNGKEALEILKTESIKFDCIILDLNMPEMSGDEMLIKLKAINIMLPHVVVLSGYVDNEIKFEKCLNLGIIYIIKKPCELSDLEEIIKSIINKTVYKLMEIENLFNKDNLKFIKNVNKEFVLLYNISLVNNEKNLKIDYDEVKISEIIKKREELLKEHYINSVNKNFSIKNEEPLLVIGRRWNSWYPSFFKVKGGAYAVVGPINNKKNNPTAIIDPGFTFLETMNDLNISVDNMESCVITHNHPDHIGGIFEYIACRNTLGCITQILCNPTVGDILQTYNGNKISIQILDEYFTDLLNYELRNNSWQKVEIKGFKTSHKEVGIRNHSFGIILSTSVCDNEDSCEHRDKYKTIILGDTEYDPVQHRNIFIPILTNQNVKIIVLHIGSSQIKSKRGGHLYLDGLHLLLSDINCELGSQDRNDKILVLISEWGLEHANKDQINGICPPSVSNKFDNEDIIKEIITLLKKPNYRKINILPADIGLKVGMNTGKIYLDNGKVLEPEKVNFNCNMEGIQYF